MTPPPKPKKPSPKVERATIDRTGRAIEAALSAIETAYIGWRGYDIATLASYLAHTVDKTRSFLRAQSVLREHTEPKDTEDVVYEAMRAIGVPRSDAEKILIGIGPANGRSRLAMLRAALAQLTEEPVKPPPKPPTT